VVAERVLALDMGTSSARAMVLAGGRPGQLARRPVRLTMADHGTGTVDGRAYQAALVECIDELQAAGALDGVDLVATSGQWHSLVPVDGHGDPLGPVLTWLDTRPAPAPGAAGPADPKDFHQRTGTWWHSLYWTVRVPWLRERLDSPVGRFLGLPELILADLLDEAPMSVSMASGAGMLDLATMRWDAEACELAGVDPAELPELAPPGWRGRLRPAYARRWPALREAGWAQPTGDGAASNFGSDCADERRAAVTVGTSAAVRMVQQTAPDLPMTPLPETLWRYRVDHDCVVTGAAYSAGGNLFSWATSTLRLPEGPELEAALERIEPGSGAWADPRFAGDRPPGTAAAGSGELRGIGLTTTAVELWAGLMDGVCRLVARDLAELETTRTHPGQYVDVVLAGRAVAASPWWRRAFRAALAPRGVADLAEPEVGALGAARVAVASRDAMM
jgi:gluconokinase